MEIEVLDGGISLDEALIDAPPEAVRRQVSEYERGDRRRFDLPVSRPKSFLGRVMEAMQAVPYGETRTYGDLAATLGTAPIAVGRACGLNPVPLIVPCHRIVGSDGSLRGSSAPGGVALKRRLLEHERSMSAD
jgi:methylated-DNA-[protein]-cysteine S-methyltransferase